MGTLIEQAMQRKGVKGKCRLTSSCSKAGLQVELPLVLDMTGYRWNPEATVYDLQGVIVHDGALVTEGHYYTFVQERGQWREFNDEKVIRVNVMYSCSRHVSWKILLEHFWHISYSHVA